MTKKQIKKLALASFVGNSLDENLLKKITSRLNRNQLKQFIKELQMERNKRTVTVLLAKKPTDTIKERFQKLYPDKQILYGVDKSLLLGVKIVENDLITEFDLQHALHDLTEYIASRI